MSFRLAALLVLLAPLAEAGRPPALVLTHVHVVPMDTERVLRDQTVVVEDGTIRAIGPAGDVAIPPGAEVVDGHGSYLLPGLADLHVHVEREYELPLYLANGVTTVLNNKGGPWHLELEERLESGAALGPRFFSCGPFVIGDATDAAGAERQVQETVAAGWDCVKIIGNWTPEAYGAVVRASRAAGIPLLGHAPRNLPFDIVLEGGYQRLAHLEELVYTTKALDDWVRASGGADDPAAAVEETVRELARATRAAGLSVVPTQVVIDHYVRRGTDAFAELVERPYTAYADPVTARVWRSAGGRPDGARFQRQFRLQQLLLRALHDEGVPIALGTDSETQTTLTVMPGWGAWEELALYVEAGLTPYEALRTATVDAAAFLGVSDAGTIEVGKRADLVLVGGDPLADVAQGERVEGVVLAGRWLPKDELEDMLDDVRERHWPMERAIVAIDSVLAAEGVVAAARAFAGLDAGADVAGWFERTVNRFGYAALREGNLPAAIEAFEVNNRTFPRSANTYDSLADAHIAAGDTTRAIELYEQALVVDPDFENARTMLARLRGTSP